MALSNVASAEEFGRVHVLPETNFYNPHQHASVVSWAAIFAGAVAAAALSLILLLLGAGLGLSSVSPWAHTGISASAFGASTIVWLTVTQLLASGMGGYLAGRLRQKWTEVHVDEVYFRDTAHGFLAWAVASLATAALLTSAIGGIVNGGVHAGASLTGGVATAAMTSGVGAAETEMGKSDNTKRSESGAMGYFVDSLFRKDANTASATLAEHNTNSNDTAQKTASSSEVTRIFINAITMKSLLPADLNYVSQMVASRTGLTQQEAEKRVNDIYTSIQLKEHNAELAAKDVADKARKSSVYATLWLFVSLLMGAFAASLAATWGGRCRDA